MLLYKIELSGSGFISLCRSKGIQIPHMDLVLIKLINRPINHTRQVKEVCAKWGPFIDWPEKRLEAGSNFVSLDL